MHNLKIRSRLFVSFFPTAIFHAYSEPMLLFSLIVRTCQLVTHSVSLASRCGDGRRCEATRNVLWYTTGILCVRRQL